ncbi:MAG: hypothetical protein M0C28_43910 [Candidatus Moduliflexus flocculans]|nr:hypothetical protein [Candidatus Moduliflexus flocculans]
MMLEGAGFEVHGPRRRREPPRSSSTSREGRRRPDILGPLRPADHHHAVHGADDRSRQGGWTARTRSRSSSAERR